MPTLSELFHLPGNDNTAVFVPFTAFLRIEPIQGKRSEVVRDMQKKAAYVENALEDLCQGAGTGTDAEETEFDFAKPVAYTPAFGDKPARLTIHGHACRRTSFTKTPVGNIEYDNDGVEVTGVAAGNPSNRTPSTDLKNLCRALKAALESASGFTCYRLELAGYIFGLTGTHFPR